MIDEFAVRVRHQGSCIVRVVQDAGAGVELLAETRSDGQAAASQHHTTEVPLYSNPLPGGTERSSRIFVEDEAVESCSVLAIDYVTDVGKSVAHHGFRKILLVNGHGSNIPFLDIVARNVTNQGEALCAMARQCGYEVIVIDPRSAFLRPERFPGARLMGEWPQAAFAQLQPDARTAVVLLTHDPKIDDPALLAVLPTPAFYVGALGSTRTHARRHPSSPRWSCRARPSRAPCPPG